jgi:cyclopropane fatty-acyl-phospholipid synthase-like methyltransferase
MREFWDERYAAEHYIFGTEPNKFLASQAHLLKPGQQVLAVADGEGRNSVWLARHGVDVLSVDFSPVAQEKAKRLAAENGVSIRFEQADLTNWVWGENRFDVIVAIFIQFVGPEGRSQMFEGIKKALKPGGYLIMQGYTPKQVEYKTGGPPHVENMYTPELLQDSFGDFEILHLNEHEEVIDEGPGHSGHSALIDLVARK